MRARTLYTGTMSTHLLMIEDDTRLARMVGEYLGQSGFQFAHAANGTDGLAQLQAGSPTEPADLVILEVAPDYSWALIGYPGREMAWVFAREPNMDPTLYRQLALRLRDKYEVNTDKLKRVPQRPEQVGRLGFEVPNSN